MKTAMLTLCLVLAMTSALPAGAKDKPLAGGYSPACVTNQETLAMAAFAVQAQEKAMNKDKDKKQQLELVSVLKAETQVVAGMNYKLELKVKLDGKEQTAQAIVWWQAWRKPDPCQLTSWEWKKDEPPKK